VLVCTKPGITDLRFFLFCDFLRLVAAEKSPPEFDASALNGKDVAGIKMMR
jgi:hypothetical protein